MDVKIFLLLAILSLSVFLMGCTSSTNNDGNRRFGPRGNFTNLTEEQRQQLIQERQQLAIDACRGKSEGDACDIQMQNSQNPRGDQNGTCKAQNGQLMCMFQFNGRFNSTRGN